MNGLRSLVGYASVCFISITGYYTFKYIQGKHFIGAVFIWFFFGLIQLFINKQFGMSLLSRLSTSEGRGITSLAVEPSFYSIICLFFLVLNDVFKAKGAYSKRVHLVLFFVITSQVFFARAGVGVVLFMVYLGAKVISSRGVLSLAKGVLGLSAVALLGVLVLTAVLSIQFTRIGMLVYSLTHDPIGLMLSDGSTADRLLHILISHLSVFYSYGIGFGLGNWNENAMDIASNTGGFVLQLANVNITLSGRIMSGWGTAIFELGIVGIFFMISFLFLMRKGFKRTSNEMKSVYLSSAITIYFTMLMAVPISFPLFGYVIGVFAYLQTKENVKTNTYN